MLPNLSGLSLQSAAPALALAPNAAASDADGELGREDLSSPFAPALDLDMDQMDVDGKIWGLVSRANKVARERIAKATLGMKPVDGLGSKKYDSVGLRMFLLKVIEDEFKDKDSDDSALNVMLRYGVNLKSTRVSDVPTLFPRPGRLLGQKTAFNRYDSTLERWKDTVKTSMYNVGGYQGMLRALEMGVEPETEDGEESVDDSTEDDSQRLVATKLRSYGKPRSDVVDLGKDVLGKELPNMHILGKSDLDEAVRKSLASSAVGSLPEDVEVARHNMSNRMFGTNNFLDGDFLMMATQIGQVIGVSCNKRDGDTCFTQFCKRNYEGKVGREYHLTNKGSIHSLAVDMIIVVPLSKNKKLNRENARYSYGVRPSLLYDPTKYLTYRNPDFMATILYPANAMCTFLKSPEVKAACSGKNIFSVRNTLQVPDPIAKGVGDADAVRFYSWEECAMLSAYKKGTLPVEKIAYGAVVGL